MGFVKSVVLKNEAVNMGTWVLKVLLVSGFSISVLGIQTSDKLDFGDTPHRSSLVTSEKIIPVKVSRTVDILTSPSEHISISCGSTGCNTTNNNNSVETEVVVRVKTNVNLNKNQNQDIEDVSDVPIVVGYRGSAPDETPNEEQFRSYSPTTPDPNVISSRSDYTPLRPLYSDSPISSGRVYGDYGSSEKNYSPYGSLHTESPVNIGGGRGRHGLISERPYREGYLNFRPQTNGYPGKTYSTTVGYYEPTSTSRIPNEYYDPSSPRIEIPNNYYASSSPRSDIPNNYYDISSPRTVEINGVSSPLSATIPYLNRRNNDFSNFRDNEEEPRIPYYQHTYNKQYFGGEEPPLHPLSYPKSNTFNPVEFRDTPRNKWRPAFWDGRPNKYSFNNAGSNFINPFTHDHNRPFQYSQTNDRANGDTGCSCREQRTDDESNSYAAASGTHHIAVQKKDPGASIDGKLAPLN